MATEPTEGAPGKANGADGAEAGSDTARLETFADGVMAIAITLLILDVKIPPDAEAGLANALVEQWPSYAAYVVSFLTIGIIWMNHHRMFKLIARSTNAFLMLNVLFLMVISFIPFPTALVAAYAKAGPHDARIAAGAYGATMFLVAIMFNVVWRYAAKDMRLLVDGLDPVALAKGTRGYSYGPIAYAVITLIALVNPYVSLGLFAALTIYWVFPASGPG